MHSPKLNTQLPTMEISGNVTHPLSSPLSDYSITGKLFRFRHTIPEIHTLELLTALTIFVTFHSLRQAKHHGLPVFPVIGMLPSLLFALRTNTYDWITSVLSRQGGTFTFTGPRFTNLKCVVTSDPRNLEHLLKTNFSNFPKGDYFRYILRDLLGDGIFNADDELWRRQRKTASIEFHSLAFRTLTVSSLNELVYDRLLPVLDSSTTTAIDLQDVLLRLTFDNVCMIAFGVDPGCLRLNSPEIPFAKAFEEVTECTVFRFVMPTALWKVMRFFNVGSEKNLRRALRRVEEFADEVIRSRKEELSCGVGRERKDLLTVFMRSKDEDGNGFSDKFLRDICVNFILAGRDTSSVALSWFFWLVGRNPAVEERILEEMCRILEERENSGWRDGNIPVVFKAEEVKKMEYLQAALSEALRLYPSVPVDHKEVREDEAFPDGTVLKKGTKVIYAIYAMGRMESIWGKDCQEFKPERWLRDGKFMSESPYKFSAFNGGPRLCLGKDFAYYQMKFVAANIIFRYQVKVVKDFPVVPKLALTMYMKHGLMVNLCRRNLR